MDREVALIPVGLAEDNKPWSKERIEDRIRWRLELFSRRLGSEDWLESEFTAGDLMMIEALRRLNGSGLVEEYPNLAAYVARGEARPTFRKAFAAQLAVFHSAQIANRREDSLSQRT